WDEKPYVTPAQFREFCAPVVPLLRAEGFVVVEGESFSATAQLAQFDVGALPAGRLTWRLEDADGAAVREGALSFEELATGALHDLGTIELDVVGRKSPARYELVLEVEGNQ